MSNLDKLPILSKMANTGDRKRSYQRNWARAKRLSKGKTVRIRFGPHAWQWIVAAKPVSMTYDSWLRKLVMDGLPRE
jgi:hypothetical protein